MALCSLSTGRIATPRRARRVRHERAGHHQHFLVGERDRLARLDRREHRFERRRARRGAEHDVDVGMRGDRDQPVGPATPASRPRSTRRRAAPQRVERRRRWPSRSPGGSARPARRARSAFVAGGEADDAQRDRDARRRRRARSGRSSRSSRGWRCASCRLPGSVLQDDVVHRRGEQQRVDAIEHAAVAGNQRASCPSRRRCASASTRTDRRRCRAPTIADAEQRAQRAAARRAATSAPSDRQHAARRRRTRRSRLRSSSSG